VGEYRCRHRLTNKHVVLGLVGQGQRPFRYGRIGATGEEAVDGQGDPGLAFGAHIAGSVGDLHRLCAPGLGARRVEG
jgi:hypothetical protein